MKSFRLAEIAALAMQLERGPKRFALRHLLQIEFLLSVIEPQRSYPFDFVVHALTGFRPVSGRDDEDRLLSGAALRDDLPLLAERISASAAVSIDACPDEVYSIGELARRFDVSTKTIFRWRQRGLVGWRFRFPDRRVRTAFPDRCVRRFVAENADLVVRGSSFSQLTNAERSDIVARAAALVGASRATVNAVARAIAHETGRAVETVRLILKHHDEANPGAGIFNRPAIGVEGDDDRIRVWEAYVDGASVDAIAARFGRSVGWVYRVVQRMRARDMKARRIEYIFAPEFEAPDADAVILKDPRLAPAGDGSSTRPPADLPPYLQQLFRVPLLTREREFALFRKMNYLKFKASRRCAALDPDTARPVELDRIDGLLAEAGRVKNEITQANLRLVVSIAKKHVRGNRDFFEVVSDGNLSLLKAADKFDFTRGFKFSTYAAWAIMKNYARATPSMITHAERYQTGRDEYIESVPARVPDESPDEIVPVVRSALDRMLGSLTEREQRVLRRHYGLDESGQTMTLEEIGKLLGVSKERIRQIEARAVSKLRLEFQEDFGRLVASR